jgi:hypothetical protein
MRWIGVGGSDAADSRTAGAEAIARAVAGRPDARLLVVFASSRHDLQALVTGVEIPLVGCTTAGEIATDGPGDDGVVVMALGGPGFAVSTASATRVRRWRARPSTGSRAGRTPASCC